MVTFNDGHCDVSVVYEILEGVRFLAITFYGISWAEVDWVNFLLASLSDGGVCILVDTRTDTTSITLESEGIECPEHSTFRLKVWIGLRGL